MNKLSSLLTRTSSGSSATALVDGAAVCAGRGAGIGGNGWGSKACGSLSAAAKDGCGIAMPCIRSCISSSLVLFLYLK